MLDQDRYYQNIIEAVKDWVLVTIIGFNFCPFAKKEFERETIHYGLYTEADKHSQLMALANEFKRLEKNHSIETSIIIFANGVESFFDYLDLLDLANDLLDDQGYRGIFQLASFHPDYCFEGAQQDDPANYTNRSPYPLIHIIREASLEKVLDRYPNPKNIPERNIKLANQKGAQVFKDILKRIQTKHR